MTQAQHPDLTTLLQISTERILVDRLTSRELQVVQLLGRGLTTDDVADQLELSAHTVRTHIKNAMGRLDCGTRVHAAAMVARVEAFDPTTCIRCGCTDDHACMNHDLAEACTWAKPGLCSACALDAGEGWEHPGAALVEEAVAA